MKYLHPITFILLIFIFSSCFQKPLKKLQSTSTSIDSTYIWNIETSEKGSMMFLDVPYQPSDSSGKEYLTLSVAKDKSKNRPSWISIILPCPEVQSDTTMARPKLFTFLFLKETEGDSLESKTDLLENSLLLFYFEECTEGTFTVRMIDGFSKDPHTKANVDIFRKFQEFDRVYFFIFYTDGSEKVIKIPLHSFQKQYNELESWKSITLEHDNSIRMHLLNEITN